MACHGSDGTIAIDTRSVRKRVVFAAVVVILIAPPLYCAWRIWQADRIARADQTFDGFTRALECDPGNAVLWWRRGRSSHYSVENPDIPKAMRDYRKALELNPRIGQAWLDLADCCERLGQHGDADQAYRNACVVRTFSPATRWQAGNYYLRRGNLSKMYENFRIAALHDLEKVPAAIELSWKVDPDRRRALNEVVPDSLPAHLRCLDFLVARDELDLARNAWARAVRIENQAKDAFKPRASFSYIDLLVAKARIPDALRVWDEALQKAGTGLRETRFGAPAATVNLVWNGSFEQELLQGGFDWRCAELPGLDAQIDGNRRVDGLRCLQLSFDDCEASSGCLSQIVPIPHPGAYLLEFHTQTEGLAASRMPYVAVESCPSPAATALRVPIPAEGFWQKGSGNFVVGRETRAVRLVVRQDTASEGDTRLSGSLWLDAFEIRSISRPHVQPESVGRPIVID